jgi:hypothetical protein
MKYDLNYQHLPKGHARPVDQGPTVAVSVDENGFALIPNVGDFVSLDNSMNDKASFRGRVKTRAFYYIQGRGDSPDSAYCHINIVVEETDDDWGALIKE